MRLGRIALAFLLGLPMLGAIVLLGLYLIGEVGQPILYRLPGGFRGWVGIRYEDPTCPALGTEGWYLVVSVSAEGRACTLSPVPRGWRYNRYEYLYSDGRRRKLSGNGEKVLLVGSTGPQKPSVETLFIGSAAELKDSWSRRSDLVREMSRSAQ